MFQGTLESQRSEETIVVHNGTSLEVIPERDTARPVKAAPPVQKARQKSNMVTVEKPEPVYPPEVVIQAPVCH